METKLNRAVKYNLYYVAHEKLKSQEGDILKLLMNRSEIGSSTAFQKSY